jgi:glyoxylase-like metal-dependent hydrolase (beta-lactamase superfamily II)
MTVSALQYDVRVSGLLPARDAALPTGEAPHWSPLAHTLIHGPTEAALVDPPITVAQATALADWVETFGKRLTTIYVTHWHADHWLTAGELTRRFPGARVYATPPTIARMRSGTPGGVPAALWSALFPGQLPEPPIPVEAEPVPAGGLAVDGEPLIPVQAGHSDTDDTTVLHVPSLGLVAAGDVVYNNVHQYLAETGDGGWDGWHRALDVVAGLHPDHVVAGHKDAARDDEPENIELTRRYLDDAARLLAVGPTREEFFARMLAAYPDRVNPYTVWLSARRLIPEG